MNAREAADLEAAFKRTYAPTVDALVRLKTATLRTARHGIMRGPYVVRAHVAWVVHAGKLRRWRFTCLRETAVWRIRRFVGAPTALWGPQ